MSRLGKWLAAELQRRGLSQKQLSDRAQVAQFTHSGVLDKGHKPQYDTLFRLADAPHSPRVEILYRAGHLPSKTASSPSSSTHSARSPTTGKKKPSKEQGNE